MNIINNRNDLDAAPPADREKFMEWLAGTLHEEDPDGSITTDESTVARFGFTADDFPDAPVAPYEPPEHEPDAVPQVASRRQLLLTLANLETPITRDNIRALLAGNEPALIEFEEAHYFRRDHPLVGQLAAELGMTGEQVDDLFRTASEL